MSSDPEDLNDEERLAKPGASVMRGMKIRDEFVCPITYELMREPVVASDGHTYEKHAIEKWLKSNHTSPRSGEPMESLIIPNMNLKKLIQDIINEGGAGFYTSDVSNKDRIFEVCPEKVLILECLGPPESDWNQQSFVITGFGCVGGRKQHPEDSASLRETMLFKDITVSRRHFEITQAPDHTGKNKIFSIRDLGSAGGTYIRIKFGNRKQLHPGMIILLGKHQFTVSSIDEGTHASESIDMRKSVSAGTPVSRKSMLNNNVIMQIMENAERIIADISRNDNHESHKDELSARLKSLTAELSHLQIMDEGADGGAVMEPDTPHLGRADSKRVLDSKDAFHSRLLDSTMTHQGSRTNLSGGADAKDAKGTCADATMADAKSPNDASPGAKSRAGAGSLPNYAQRRCTLTCCAPDGSPLQGISFVVGVEGATMGRKHTNAIPLYMKVPDPTTGEERIANVDTAISSEHARVEFDEKTGAFFISDGTASKASTNGTWFRLSGPHQESPPHVMSGGTEVLIGTVRFVAKESMTISERKVTTDDEK